jgi:hypothetical protein
MYNEDANFCGRTLFTIRKRCNCQLSRLLERRPFHLASCRCWLHHDLLSDTPKMLMIRWKIHLDSTTTTRCSQCQTQRTEVCLSRIAIVFGALCRIRARFQIVIGPTSDDTTAALAVFDTRLVDAELCWWQSTSDPSLAVVKLPNSAALASRSREVEAACRSAWACSCSNCNCKQDSDVLHDWQTEKLDADFARWLQPGAIENGMSIVLKYARAFNGFAGAQ